MEKTHPDFEVARRRLLQAARGLCQCHRCRCGDDARKATVIGITEANRGLVALAVRCKNRIDGILSHKPQMLK